MLLQFLKIEVIHFQTQKSNSLISSVSWRAVSFIKEPPVCWYIPKLIECQGINDSYWKEEVLPQKAFDILQNRCGGWGEGVSQYIRGLVKTQAVLVNYNSFLGFGPEELRDWQQPQYLLQNPYNYGFMGLFGFQCQIWKFVKRRRHYDMHGVFTLLVVYCIQVLKCRMHIDSPRFAFL